MKKKDNPISLFSFQDIVTSLTGIMIIVILVISLQMLEATQEAEARREPDEEYLMLKAENEELLVKLKNLQSGDGVELAEEVLKLLKYTPDELNAMSERAKKLLEMIGNEKLNLEQKIALLQQQIQQMKEQLKASQEELEKLQAQEKELSKPSEESKQLSEEVTRIKVALEESQRIAEALRANIEQVKQMVEITFVGYLTRKPVLVECIEHRFRARLHDGGEIKEFSGRSLDSNLSDLASWLKRMDLKQVYPVLLYRKSAIENMDAIEYKLLNLSRDVRIGKEPISDKVKVF